MRVTVGIPTYNRARLVREAIESVLAQTFEEVGVVVADNASTDDTRAVVATYPDDRVRYLGSERNLGLIGNFNRLIDLVETEYFVLLPDDDILYPEHLETVVAVLDRHRDVGLAHTGFDLIDADSRVIRSMRSLPSREVVTVDPCRRAIERMMTSAWPIGFSSVVYRTEAIRAADGFREREEPFSDLGLWLRIARAWSFAYVARPLAGFRMHEETVTMRIGTENGAVAGVDERAVVHAQARYRRREGFLDEGDLAVSQERRWRALSTLQLIRETAGRGVPWAETTRSLGRVVRMHPSLVAHPATWRVAVAHVAVRPLRSAAARLR